MSNMPLNMRVILAKWTLRELPPEALPQIAVELIEGGDDSPAIRRVAAHVAPTWFEVHDDFERLLREQGLNPISHEQAWLILARQIAEQIVDGRIAAETGAAQLAHFGLDQPYQSYGASYREEILRFELLIVDQEQFDESERAKIRIAATEFLEKTYQPSR